MANFHTSSKIIIHLQAITGKQLIKINSKYIDNTLKKFSYINKKIGKEITVKVICR